MQDPTVLAKPVNSWEYAELYREGELNYGQPPSFSLEEIEKFRNGEPGYPNSDWWDATFKRWTPMQQHNLSATGGSEKIKFFMSAGMQDQASLYTSGDWNFNRYNARINVDAEITSDLSVGFDMSFRLEKREKPGGNGLSQVRLAQPIWPTELPNGEAPWAGGTPPTSATTINKSGFTDDERQYFRGKISLSYDIPKVNGLKANAAINYYTYNTREKSMSKPYNIYRYDFDADIYELMYVSGQKYLTEKRENYRQIYPMVSFTYEKNFGEHSVQGLLLAEWIDTEKHKLTAERKDLLSTNIPYLFAGSTENILNNGNANETGRASYVGRVNYNYKGKYLFESSFRYDASHKFAKDNRWGFFPSVSAGWRISEEPFMETIDWIDNLKIRASYSQMGDDNLNAYKRLTEENVIIGDFQYLSGYEIRDGDKEKYLLDETVGTIIHTTGMANPLITWFDMTSYNIGADATFMGGLIGFEFDLFYRKTTNIFGQPLDSYPSTFGADLPKLNINSTDNRGIEVLLSHSHKIGDFKYTVAANATYVREKYVDWAQSPYDDPDEIRIYQKAGQLTNRWIGYVSDGLFMSQSEIDNHPIDQDQNGNTSLKPGDIIYKDLNGDKVINWRDQDVIGYGDFPDITYGMNIDLNYKGINLSALFQGASRFNMNMTAAARNPFQNGSNPFSYHYKYRWTPDPNDPTVNSNPHVKLPAINDQSGGNENNQKTSDYWLQDNTFLRLKNLNVSYDLPSQLVKKIGFQGVRFYVAGTNLLTISKLGIYKNHWDPEGRKIMMGEYIHR